MLAIVRNIASLRQPEAVRGWARRIAVREAMRVVGGGRSVPVDPAVLAVAVAVGDNATSVEVRSVLALRHIDDSLPEFDEEIGEFRILRRDGEHLVARLRSAGRIRIPVTLDVDLEPGWCWMVARRRFYVAAFAAEPAGEHTRFAHLEGLMLPGPPWVQALVRRCWLSAGVSAGPTCRATSTASSGRSALRP